jgi:methionyl-tRNA formyltransferase
MTQQTIYPYASGNLLEERNTYFYSPYYGEGFLEAWQARRREAGAKRSAQGSLDALPIVTETDRLIEDMATALGKSSDETAAALARLDRLVQRFEVTKRIYDGYTDGWRAMDPTRYRTVASYVRFSHLLSLAFGKTTCLTYMNALLKCNDILNAIDLPANVEAHLPRLFAKERAHVEKFRKILPVPAASEPALEPSDASESRARAAPQILNGVIMIACASARSQAYIQAMLAKGVVPEEVIFLGPDKERGQRARGQACLWRGRRLPDLSESFTATCAKADIRVRTTGEADVNSDEVLQALEETDAHLAIYSGIGGQIVQKRILDAGPRFLHIHAGWLPDYRGSTTIYYSLLHRKKPGASAIFLDVNIDTGPILKRQTYHPPPAWTDVDLVYDGAIRADLLCQVLAQYQEQGQLALADTQTQTPEIGRTYYVIHPVLKHLALLSIGATPNDA